MDRERQLLVLYVCAFVVGVLAGGSLAIAWLYWEPTLNTCVSVNCGCILYSVVTFSTFVGGAGWLCRYAVYLVLPILLWTAAVALFHAYRVCVPRKAPTRRTVTFHEDGSRNQVVPREASLAYLPLTVVSVVITLLLCAQTWIVTAGYYNTCQEYRKSISSQLNANGNLAELVFDRLSCGTVFDFLDYLQPDPPLLLDQYRRTYRIHTAYYLLVAVTACWLHTATWTVISILNIHYLLSSTKT